MLSASMDRLSSTEVIPSWDGSIMASALTRTLDKTSSNGNLFLSGLLCGRSVFGTVLVLC